MQNMKDVYATAINTVQCTPLSDSAVYAAIDNLVALNDKASVESINNASLNHELASQLQTCVRAIEAKQPEMVIGQFTLNTFLIKRLTISMLSAQSAGQETWEAIHTMVKNVSEAMLTPLPNFWRISKSFMEGRYKKVVVCSACSTWPCVLTSAVFH